MDLLQQLRCHSKQFASSATWLMIPILLFGCAATAKQSDENTTLQPVEVTEPEVEETAQSEMDLPLTPELVYYVLAAEIAGQRGQLDIAVDLYNQAAELTDSPSLAGRSARISTFSRDPKRIDRALTRWQEVSPEEAEVYVMRVPFLLMEDNFPEVVTTMNKALALEPENKEKYLESLAANLSEKGDAERGLQTLLELDLYKNDDPAARFTYARLAAFFQRFEVAEIAVDELLEEFPRNEAYLALKADLLQTFDKNEEALKLIAKAAEQKAPVNLCVLPMASYWVSLASLKRPNAFLKSCIWKTLRIPMCCLRWACWHWNVKTVKRPNRFSVSYYRWAMPVVRRVTLWALPKR